MAAYSSAAFVYFTILCVGLCIAATFTFTKIRFILQNRICRQYKGEEPPSLPYYVPWFGNALSVLWNTHEFLQHLKQTATRGQPVKLRLANEKAMYVISKPDHVQKLFKETKEVGSEEFIVRVLKNVNKFPQSDCVIMLADQSGRSTIPLLPDVPEQGRIWRAMHDNYQKNLAGIKPVKALTRKFVHEFVQELENVVVPGSWCSVSLNTFMEDKMFRASTVALVGPKIFEIQPHFAKDFWEFDKFFMSFLYGLPKFMFLSGWQARDRVFDAVTAWNNYAWENMDWDDLQPDCDWEVNFGSRLVRTREEMFDGFGYSFEGRVASEVALIWAINSNTIPMVSWILIEIISDASLLQRVQHEVLSAAVFTDMELALDWSQTAALPLLESCYLEQLRLRASIHVVRELRNDIEIDGYCLKGGNLVIAPSWLAHYDESWNTRDHPASSFYSDRFLKTGEDNLHVPSKGGRFFPYGGGQWLCPGRHFAKAEILAAVAQFVLMFEIECVGFVDDNGRPSRKPGMGKETRGTMRLDRDLRVRLKRRPKKKHPKF